MVYNAPVAGTNFHGLYITVLPSSHAGGVKEISQGLSE
jgi:hypothetical protein